MQCHTHSLTNIDKDEAKWLHIRQSYHATAGTLAFGIKEINIVWVIVSHSYQEVIGYLTLIQLLCPVFCPNLKHLKFRMSERVRCKMTLSDSLSFVSCARKAKFPVAIYTERVQIWFTINIRKFDMEIGDPKMKTLPKALRTQVLTALTSNFVLVCLVQYAW